MIGDKIRYHRKEKRLTLEQLSDGICAVSYLSKIEMGKTTPSDQVIELLCKRLGISAMVIEDIDRYSDTLKLIEDWYKQIINREKKEAEALYNTLQKTIENVENPNLLTYYKIITIRYFLLMGRIEEVDKWLQHTELVCTTEELSFHSNHVFGLYHYFKNELILSLKHYKTAEERLKNLKFNNQIISDLFYQLSLVSSRLQYVSMSTNYAEMALEYYNRDYNFHRSAECELLLGINYYKLRNFELSKLHLMNAIKLADVIDNDAIKGTSHHNLGLLHSSKNLHNDAISHYLKSLHYKQLIGSKDQLNTIYLIAKESLNFGLSEQAYHWLKKGLLFHKNNKFTEDNEYFIKLKLLEHELRKDFSSEYEEYLVKKAIPYFENKNDWNSTADYAETLAEYYSKQFQYKKSSYYFSLANESRKKMKFL